MRIVISAESGAFEGSSASTQISEMCNYVRPGEGDSLLIPRPGKLMELIKILKEHGIRYHVQDLQSNRREGS